MSTSIVFACDMSALSSMDRAAHAQVLRTLFGAVTAIRPVPDGYGFEFPLDGELLVRAAEFIALERRCCPFFDFHVEVRAGAKNAAVQITGPRDVEPFIRAEFAGFLPAGTTFPD